MRGLGVSFSLDAEAERRATLAQIVLYVVSRVITSFLPRASPAAAPTTRALPSKNGVPPPPGAPYPKPRPPNARLFELYAAVTWGAVMYLFKERRDTLQGGMVGSMQVSFLFSFLAEEGGKGRLT